MENAVKSMFARAWTTTEEADICCYFKHGEVDFHEDYANFPFCKLEAVDDNLYRAVWWNGAEESEGQFTLFCSLPQALETVNSVHLRML